MITIAHFPHQISLIMTSTTTQMRTIPDPNMWMQLLEDASNDKRLAEKHLLVLGT